jgi:two-component system nitrogen regulation response regulator GlnG
LPRLLVVDDEANVRYSLEKGLRSESLEVVTAGTGRQAIQQVQKRRPDAVVLDVRLPDMSGLEVFDQLRQLSPHLPIIVITAFTTTETAIEAMKRGALDYLLKPVDFHQLRDLVHKAVRVSQFQHVPTVFDQEEAAGATVERIVGRSAAMQEVYKTIGRFAPQDVPVLIQGESGTGKELVARALYQHSRRNQEPFLAINCAAIPETLLESELFGHERGAFTGADHRRIGKFEQAHRGTIFLDEIGDMAAATQAKILRLLQEQRFERVGGAETIQTDVRLLAATNQDLEQLVADGSFRRDLFYRLNGFVVRLPALRERENDLPLLVDHFLKVFNPQVGKSVHTVSAEVREILQAHEWAGNVRELQSVVKYSLIHAVGEKLTPDCLPDNLLPNKTPPPVRRAGAQDGKLDLASMVRNLLAGGEADVYRKVCLVVDRIVLHEVLGYARGNQVHASELLGISRTTLRAKLRQLGVSVEKQLLADGTNEDLLGGGQTDVCDS